MRPSVLRGFTATLLARAIYMGSSAILMVALARYLLLPGEYGTLFWAIAILSVIQLGADWGFGKSVARYVAEYRKRDPRQVPHLLRLTVRYKLVLLAIVAGSLVLVHESLAGALGAPEIAPFLAAGSLFVIVKSFSGFSQVTFQGFNRLVYSAAINAISGVGRLVAAVGFVLIGLGALGAFYGYVVGYAIAAAVGLTILYWGFYRGQPIAPTVEPGLTRRLLEYSVPLAATRSANVLDKQIDIVLVGFLLNPLAVAFYTLAKQITDFVLAPAASLGFTISPNLGEGKAVGDLESARRLYESALRTALLVYLPTAAGLAIVAGPGIQLIFGTDYGGAVPVLQLLAAFVVLQAITNLTSDGLDYLGRARARAIAKGTTAVGNFGLNLLLIPTIGVVGAALATVITHSIYVAVNLYIVHAELGLDVTGLARDVGLIGVVTGVMALVVLGAMPLVSGLGTLVAVIGLGVSIWAGLSVASGLIEPTRVRAQLLT
ncbi:MAG: flippase [Natrialbaceae archaeon]|nr:flippase [Natrialbaceae archaeon]